jgi:hypothetical protein
LLRAFFNSSRRLSLSALSMAKALPAPALAPRTLSLVLPSLEFVPCRLSDAGPAAIAGAGCLAAAPKSSPYATCASAIGCTELLLLLAYQSDVLVRRGKEVTGDKA